MPHISPETLSKNIYDIRTDIYQLGLTAYRLINGISEIRADFDMDRAAFRDKVIRGTVISANKYKPYVPHSLRRIINKAVSINPDERYQTALEMRRALERLSIAGDCSGNAAGNLILLRGTNSYRYEIASTGKKVFSLTTYKRNMKSNIEMRFSKYCLKGLSEKELKRQLQLYCLEIIDG